MELSPTTTPTKKVGCFACRKINPWRKYDFKSTKWYSDKVDDKVINMFGPSVHESIESSNVGICDSCLTKLKYCSEFIETVKDSVSRLSQTKRLSKACEMKNQNVSIKRRALFTGPCTPREIHSSELLATPLSFETEKSQSEAGKNIQIDHSYINSDQCVTKQSVTLPVLKNYGLQWNCNYSFVNDLSVTEQHKLHEIVKQNSRVDLFIDAMMDIPSMKCGIEKRILQKLYSDCDSLCSTAQPSVLRSMRNIKYLEEGELPLECIEELKQRFVLFLKKRKHCL